eukprot:1234768-Rhodomonas_salina.3
MLAVTPKPSRSRWVCFQRINRDETSRLGGWRERGRGPGPRARLHRFTRRFSKREVWEALLEEQRTA